MIVGTSRNRASGTVKELYKGTPYCYEDVNNESMIICSLLFYVLLCDSLDTCATAQFACPNVPIPRRDWISPEAGHRFVNIVDQAQLAMVSSMPSSTYLRIFFMNRSTTRVCRKKDERE